MSRGKIVVDDNLVAGLDELAYDVLADVSGTTCYQDILRHGGNLFPVFCCYTLIRGFPQPMRHSRDSFPRGRKRRRGMANERLEIRQILRLAFGLFA